MPRKEGAPEIPVEMDGVIWQVMWDTRLKGGNLSATARALEKLFAPRPNSRCRTT